MTFLEALRKLPSDRTGAVPPEKTLRLVDVPPPTPDGNTWLWEGREPGEQRCQYWLISWLETAMLCVVGVFIGIALALGAVARRRKHWLIGWLETATLCAVGVFIGVALALGAVAILRPFPVQHEPPPIAPTRSVETPTEVTVPTRQVENRSIPISPNVLADMHRWATTLPAASPPYRVIERPIAHRIAPSAPSAVYRQVPRHVERQVAIPEAPRGYIGCPASLGAGCARLSFTEETRE